MSTTATRSTKSNAAAEKGFERWVFVGRRIRKSGDALGERWLDGNGVRLNTTMLIRHGRGVVGGTYEVQTARADGELTGFRLVRHLPDIALDPRRTQWGWDDFHVELHWTAGPEHGDITDAFLQRDGETGACRACGTEMTVFDWEMNRYRCPTCCAYLGKAIRE